MEFFWLGMEQLRRKNVAGFFESLTPCFPMLEAVFHHEKGILRESAPPRSALMVPQQLRRFRAVGSVVCAGKAL